MDRVADGLLFSALVEELRLPLLQINRLSEMDSADLAAEVALISEQALILVDAYSLAVSQTDLALEPLNIRNVLYESAHAMSPLARQADFEIDVDERVSTTPIIGHSPSVQAMLTLLATSLMSSTTEDSEPKRRLLLASHKLPGGTMVGAFSNQASALSQALVATRQLHGIAYQAVPEMGQAGSASLAIADRLGEQMAAPLKAYRHNNLAGIGSLLMPSRQLHFYV